MTTVGNAAPAVARNVHAQVDAFTHTCFMVTPYDGYVDVCEKLAELTPGDHAKKSALFNSGAEAVENAVKIARVATGRDAVAVFDHAYHGRTNLTMAMTAKNMPYKNGFGPFAGEIYRAPMSYPLRDGLTGEQAAARAIDVLDKQVGAAEPRLHRDRADPRRGRLRRPGAPGFLPALAAWAKDNGIVFVADEIQSGFCRTGDWFASDHEGVVPDLVTAAKGIAGGLPLAAVTGRAELMDSRPRRWPRRDVRRQPDRLRGRARLDRGDDGRPARRPRPRDRRTGWPPGCGELAAEHDVIADIRGRGAMMAIELCKPGTTEPDAARTAAVAAYCHQNGVVVLTCGTWGNVFRFLPPLSIGDALLDEAFDVVAEAFTATA